jgi:glycosyltransferase involved in cell wall biosynthesis
MKVGIDVSPLALTRAGTARYVRNLLAHLRGLVDVRTVAFGGRGRVWVLARELAWYPLWLPRMAAHQQFDVLHCPTYYAPRRPRVPLVVTVHDLAVFRHPEAFPVWTRNAVPRLVPPVLHAASRVIAVSEFTKRELVDVLNLDAAKIRVVPNAVADVFSPDGPQAEGDYVLAVGTLEPRKNVPRAVDAARRVGVELRVVGAQGWGGVEADGAGVRSLGEVDDEELARLYRGARAVLYPSLYEGFGLPVLEAMACGAPVVTSAGGAAEEVAGGAAVLVDARRPATIAAGLEEAVRRRDELRARGLERAAGFRWDDVARRTVDVYREAAT